MKYLSASIIAALFFILPNIALADGGFLPRDSRNFPAMGGVNSDDQEGDVFPILFDPVTGELLVKASTTISGGATALKQDTMIAHLLTIIAQLIAGQTTTEPIVIAVGTTPTLLLSASAVRRGATIQNMGTGIVFLGKGAVTTGTGIGLRGGIANNDAKGAIARTDDGDALFGVVVSGTVNVRVREVSD